MAMNPYSRSRQPSEWFEWERYLARLYRHGSLNDGTPRPQPPTGLPEPRTRTGQGVVPQTDIRPTREFPPTPVRRRKLLYRPRSGELPQRGESRSPVPVREKMSSGTSYVQAVVTGRSITPKRGEPEAQLIKPQPAEEIENTAAIPIAPLSGAQIVLEFGKIVEPYVEFIVKTKKRKGLHLKTKFGVQKLKDDKSGLYLKNNKKRKFYIYYWGKNRK